MDWLHELFETEPQLPQAPIVVPATAPAAPPQAPTRRHYYRCVGCLEVYALPQALPMEWRVTIATCGNCAEHMEYMGRVERDRLLQDHLLCNCDSRCTDARGPVCTCKCSGRNHGSGMSGYTVVTQDHGKAPIVKAENPFRLTKSLEAYRRYTRLRDPLLAERNALADLKYRTGFIPAGDFARLRALQTAMLKADKARTHQARVKTLETVTRTTHTTAQHDFDLSA